MGEQGQIRIGFYGAAGEVTGSSYVVDTGRAKVLVDCGLFQGGAHAEAKNRRGPGFEASSLDAAVLTHAHLDHAGRLPLLHRWGYHGPIYTTEATIDLCGIMLPDAAHVQKMHAERATRSRQRAGRGGATPLYDDVDVQRVLKTFEAVEYDQPREVAPGVTARFVDAGHILGSASVELRVDPGDGRERVIVFSGDVGVNGAPLLRDPVKFDHADLVVLESTYGDRDHRDYASSVEELRGTIAAAQAEGGKVIIPSFAVGRTQNLLYELSKWEREGGAALPDVYVDSPLATEATKLYRRHRDCFDEEAWAVIRGAGGGPMTFDTLRFTRSAAESRALNNRDGGVVIIAGAGMMTGGRVVHHLKHSLWKSQTHLIVVGYQAEGTLGRRIVEGAKTVGVMGRPVRVNAHVHTIGGFSAHAGRTGLIEWAGAMAKSKPRVVLTHGEDKPRRALAAALEERFGMTCEMPGFKDEVVLA